MTAARRYRIEHRTVYSYSSVVTGSFGRGYLTPRDLAHQRCVSHRVVVDPEPEDQSSGTDVYGNIDSYFHVLSEHERLVVTGESIVEVDPPEPGWYSEGAAAVPWESARPSRTHGPLAAEFALDLEPPEITSAVAEYAAESFTPGRPLGAAIGELCSRIYADFTYRSGSTTVSTKVADVFAAKEGVCQDFARLALACVRSVGLAGQYVSGYLATDPPPGRERMVGVDATHAWARVWAPNDHWLAFDPTNDQFVDERYVTVAWGRDYADVPPLRGIIYTDSTEAGIAVSVDVAPLPPGLPTEGVIESPIG
ncbi:transglutaminase family protein [Aldersonia sp. NBC_00410]|jgi:transglutaminase-like putative cysteine protease|uniref:transglutaminase family protein n=1 Tax=Aldersonia sp. NBC_00410 TaxID=2975954 RepID=UPI0022523240|nr:transglutaminase family protein [Aldersonia sp. NBC_00410]MCX5043086.1 transglutaminase family protein [Aldersonia sp. NBC_00410]